MYGASLLLFILAASFTQKWAPTLFSPFRARDREAEKKHGRKMSAKIARIRAFSSLCRITLDIRFQSPNPLDRGKSKGLE
jgi:hypothetical protein